MTRRRPFSPPFGRIVGTVGEVAGELGVPADDLLAAVVACGLAAWGSNNDGEAVYRVREARRGARLAGEAAAAPR